MSKKKVIPAKALPRSRKSEKTTTQPVTINLVNTKNPKLPPAATIRGTSKGIIVRNFEFSRRLTCSSASVSKAYLNLNPGDATVFPWLSIIAKGYEKFRIHKFKVHYVHTCPATEIGQYAMYFDYDARDVPINDMALALQNYDRVDGASYVDKVLSYKKHLESLKTYYIQKVVTSSASWIVDETPAKLNIVTADGVDNKFIGNIFLDYEIELEAPAIDIGSSSTALVVLPQSNQTAGDSLRTAILNSIPVAVPGASIESTGLLLRDLPNVRFPSTFSLHSHELGVGRNAEYWYDSSNFTVRQGEPSSGFPTFFNHYDWMNSGTLARQLMQNIVVPAMSTAFIEFNQYFDLQRDGIITAANLGAYIGSVIDNGISGTVQSAWSNVSQDSTGSYNWRLSALLQNSTSSAASFLMGLAPINTGGVNITIAQNVYAGLQATLTPHLLDYAVQAVQGGGQFSRTYKRFMELGHLVTLVKQHEASSSRGCASSSSSDENAAQRPPVLKTPETFRDHASKFLRTDKWPVEYN